MSRGERKATPSPHRRQFSISAKVSQDEKVWVAELCERLGCTESELVIRAVLHRPTTRPDQLENAREHLAAAHAVRRHASNDASLDPQLVQDLIEVTRRLIAALGSGVR